MTRKIVRKLLPQDYKPFDERVPKAEADIGLFIMEFSVKFTNYIQPICLPSKSVNVFGISGVVVGYGKPDIQSTHRNLPQMATMSTVTLGTCLKKDFAHTVSRRSFCAIGTDGTPCIGRT